MATQCIEINLGIPMSINRVCTACIGDPDLKTWIRAQRGGRGCDACGRNEHVTCSLSSLCVHMSHLIRQHWDSADDNLGYCSAEGGYLGADTYDTYDLLIDEIGLELPRDRGSALLLEIIALLPDNVWCKIDPYQLDLDQALSMSWESFCNTIKYKRRFFFDFGDGDSHDSYTPAAVLNAVAQYADNSELVTSLKAGQSLYRVGVTPNAGSAPVASDFGPPPAALAMQNNRMNPPGIPMMYLASDPETARSEARKPTALVGEWKVKRAMRILDLRRIPPIPGVFSTASRNQRLQLNFLRDFRDSIVQPIDRLERVNVDYLPSQVATEFFRDYHFSAGEISGVLYGSTLCRGWNAVLFIDRDALGLDVTNTSGARAAAPWLEFEAVLEPVAED